MKRSLVRLAALTGLVVLGLFTITQAQRGFGLASAEEDSSPQPAPIPKPDDEPEPTTLETRNPFVSFRAQPASAEAETDAPSRQTEPAAEPAFRAAPPETRDRYFDNRVAQAQPNSHEPESYTPAGTAGIPTDKVGRYQPEETSAFQAEPQKTPAYPANVATEVPSGSKYGQPAGRDYPSPPAEAPRQSAADNPFPAEPARLPAHPQDEAGPLPGRGGPSDYPPADPRYAPQSLPPSEAALASSGGPRGRGLPGHKQQEGPQAPVVTLQKHAPREMQVGQTATLEVHVKNTGKVAVHHVVVADEIPRGTRLVDTRPKAATHPSGQITWELGTLNPGESAQIQMQVEPLTEGEVGSVASVTYTAQATARSQVTRPRLALEVSAPRTVMQGEKVALKIRVANPGTGVATGVVLRERIPLGLSHPAGEELEYEVGDLAPNETREITLTLSATKAGEVLNELHAYATGKVQATPARNRIEVIAPALQVKADGPKRRFLERQAVYTVEISNPGTASAERVELVAEIPQGMKFVKADNAGRYDPKTRRVHWKLDKLPAKERGRVTLAAVALEQGPQKLVVQAKAERGLSARAEEQTLVEGIAEVLFTVVDVEDPIEVGGETVYEIRVVNQGSKAASNVQIGALLPEQLRLMDAQGATRHSAQGNRLLFEPIPRLSPKADTTYRIRVKAVAPGDLRFRVQLMTDNMQAPVTKEESTRVYSDE